MLTYGHACFLREDNREFLPTCLDNHTFAHAYLFFGNDSQVSDVAHEPQVLSTIYNSHYLINLVPKLRIL